MISVMLDIETLSIRPEAVILTIGAVKFDPHNDIDPHSPLYLRVDVDEQVKLGRTVDDSTLEWWSKQPSDVRDEALSDEGRTSLVDVTKELNKYIVGVDKIWCQGPQFDIIILENAYRMIGIPVPWRYGQIRDSRTLLDLGDDSAKTNNKSAHNALADSYMQAVSVRDIYRQLGIVRK